MVNNGTWGQMTGERGEETMTLETGIFRFGAKESVKFISSESTGNKMSGSRAGIAQIVVCHN